MTIKNNTLISNPCSLLKSFCTVWLEADTVQNSGYRVSFTKHLVYEGYWEKKTSQEKYSKIFHLLSVRMFKTEAHEEYVDYTSSRAAQHFLLNFVF